MKNKIFHTQDLCLRTNLRCAESCARMEIFMSQIQVTDLTYGYEGSFDTVFENVSFGIDTDWKLGLIGRNGKGKTTFLNLLRGK